MVLGTVEGDLQDIGKSAFKSMFEAASFEVHDLGIGTTWEAYKEQHSNVSDFGAPRLQGYEEILF